MSFADTFRLGAELGRTAVDQHLDAGHIPPDNTSPLRIIQNWITEDLARARKTCRAICRKYNLDLSSREIDSLLRVTLELVLPDDTAAYAMDWSISRMPPGFTLPPDIAERWEAAGWRIRPKAQANDQDRGEV